LRRREGKLVEKKKVGNMKSGDVEESEWNRLNTYCGWMPNLDFEGYTAIPSRGCRL